MKTTVLHMRHPMTVLQGLSTTDEAHSSARATLAAQGGACTASVLDAAKLKLQRPGWGHVQLILEIALLMYHRVSVPRKL